MIAVAGPPGVGISSQRTLRAGCTSKRLRKAAWGAHAAVTLISCGRGPASRTSMAPRLLGWRHRPAYMETRVSILSSLHRGRTTVGMNGLYSACKDQHHESSQVPSFLLQGFCLLNSILWLLRQLALLYIARCLLTSPLSLQMIFGGT